MDDNWRYPHGIGNLHVFNKKNTDDARRRSRMLT